jgi:hypothetical protein
MKEILFRGKALYDNHKGKIKHGQWVIGCLLHDVGIENDEDHYLIAFFVYTGSGCMECGAPVMEYVEVDPETVGRFSGLLDSKGKQIFERDIVRYDGKNYLIAWHDLCACFTVIIPNNVYDALKMCNANKYEVIGNIHDNPELLNSDKRA